MTKRYLYKPLVTLVAAMSLGSFNATADDTQLFMLNPTATSGLPNVLFVWDNTANWEQPFATEKQAMIEAFAGLDPDTYNVGLMMFTETGNPNSNTDGGYVRAAVRRLSTTYRNQLGDLLNGLDILDDKSNGGKYGLTMWEAWQYFNGLAPNSGNSKVKADYAGNTDGTAADVVVHGLSGNALGSFAGSPYAKPPSDGCQKNYIIFISNGPAADNNADITSATTALETAGGSSNAITLSPSGSQTNVADEWARFMANHQLTDREKVYTYTIDVNPGGTGQGPGHSALLKSMASSVNGKGKYYCYGETQNALGDECRDSLTDIIDEIFKEILAVNSVFASVTLPVNVNVRGRQLNQVYMGLFRPDDTGKPLWPGNLKAYKVGQIGTTPDNKPIFGLTDQTGAAIENLDTSSTSYGFIKPTSQSFWSHTTTTGFWDADYYPEAQGNSGAQDSPDGEMVEKGGAAQRLRDFYSAISGAAYSINDSTNGRKLYTCTGGSCATGGQLSLMPFSTANAALTDSALGLNVSATVTLARSGTTVTATATDHPFVTGDSVTFSGATQTEYNGSFTVTKTGANTFTYQIVEAPASPATGTIQVSTGGSPIAISTITLSGTTATVLTTANHGLSVGNTVLISGTPASAYNNSFTVTSVPTATSFTIDNISVSPATPATAVTSSGVQFYSDSSCTTASGGSYSIKTNPSIGLTRSGTTVTVDTTANLATTLPAYVQLSGMTPSAYNGCFTTGSKLGNKQFTFAMPSSSISPQTTETGGSVDAGATSVAATITRSGTTATVIATGTFTAGQSVTITGADQTQYNGTFSVATGGSNTFTYLVSTAPDSPATGTITATGTGSGISASNLINWTRGLNVQDNDNPNPDLDAADREGDVRGYLHGDVLHSRPAVINYNRTGQPAERDIVVFYGANDGFLHAVKGGLTTAADSGGDGRELWGFIAPEHFKQLKRLYSGVPPVSFDSPKPYFFDGPLSSYLKYTQDNSDPPVDRLEGDSAKAYLYAAMRRGGEALYAFDIKSPESPVLAWKIDNTGDAFTELGQTWSEAKVTKIKSCSDPDDTDTCTDRPVLIFGAGYDATADDAFPQGTATKGRGIYVVDALDGSIIWAAGPSEPTNFPGSPARFVTVTDMVYSIPSDLAVIDRNGDGYVDRIYAPDTGGNIWRVNLPTEDSSGWTVGKFASLRTASAASGYTNHRKFLSPPDVVFGTSYDAVLIGSGDREHPFDMTTENRFYMLKDSPSLDATSGTSSASTITESTAGNNICDVTNNLLPTDLTCDTTDNPACSALLAARATADACLNTSGNKGWYIKFCEGEKVVNTPLTLAGAVNFGTNVPPGSPCLTTAINQCAPSTGEGRLYFINYRDGTPLGDTNASGTYTSSDRYHPAGGGFPPSGTQITTEVDGTVTDIVCSGSHCLQPPGSILNRRYRIYWKTDVDVSN